MILERIGTWVLFSREDARFTLEADWPLTASAVADAVRMLEAEARCKAPADLTVYKLVDDEKKEEESGMTTIGEIEKEMKEMNDRYDRLAGQLEEVLVELRAVGIAVEKLKANVKSMQDEII